MMYRLTTTRWTEPSPITSEAYAFVRENVPDDAIVMITPNVFGFRAHARRTPYFEFKCFPFSTHGAREWFVAFTEVPAKGAPMTELFNLCRIRNVHYLLARFIDRDDRDLYVRIMEPYLRPYAGENLFVNEEYALIHFPWNSAPTPAMESDPLLISSPHPE
jgi:hypothetical protein